MPADQKMSLPERNGTAVHVRWDSFCHVILCRQIWTIEQQFRIKFAELKTAANIAQSLYDCILIFPSCDFSFLFLQYPEHALYLSQKNHKVVHRYETVLCSKVCQP